MSKNLLNSIKLTKPRSNVFDLSHDVKLSCNIGQLVPVMVLEAVPGDKFNISCESLLRFAPLVAPLMHRVDVTMHYFFVPNRILWDNWENFITNTAVGTPGSVPAFPTIEVSEALGTHTPLMDYMGIPPVNSQGAEVEEISALPFAAYQCTVNEYYRDQNLIDPIAYKLEDGTNTLNTELTVLRKRAWEHDYFTSALPFAQKGAAVDIPLGNVALNDDWKSGGATPLFQNEDGTYDAGTLAQSAAAPQGITISSNPTKTQAYDPDGTLSVEPTTINDLRRAFRLQEWLEKNARGGTRYIENILSHFGVRSSDKRLQRPEYITGTKSPVQISEVLSTAGDGTGVPQGNMAGHGLSVTAGKYGNYRCEEHGYIIGIMSIMPKPAYQQGIPKHFLKHEDAFQYYWPSFAHIGEQEIKNRELYAYHADGNGTFGYIPRYAEYKFQPNRVAGDFREQLNFWHMGRIFSSMPALNQTFIEVNNAATDRVFAVTDPEEQKMWVHVYNKVRAIRPMPKFGTPTF